MAEWYGWYENKTLHFIEELEKESGRRKESLEQFYRGLRAVVVELRDRLNCATDELDDKEVAAEIVRLPR